LTQLIVIGAAVFVVRLFIIQHDCGHRAFFKSALVNDVVGSLIGIVTLTPHAYWRRLHRLHHSASGNLDKRGYGDIDTLTVREYEALTLVGRLIYRLYRNPLVMFGLAPAFQFVIWHRLPRNLPLSWRREWASVFGSNLALLSGAMLMMHLVGPDRFLIIQIPISSMASATGMWLFYVQHQFADTYWKRTPQ